jgi:hypothetical protein
VTSATGIDIDFQKPGTDSKQGGKEHRGLRTDDEAAGHAHSREDGSGGALGYGTLSLGGGFDQHINILWDETSQTITFSNASMPLSATTGTFDVYEGKAFPLKRTIPPILLAGNFQHFDATGAAGPSQHFAWYAVGAP